MKPFTEQEMIRVAKAAGFKENLKFEQTELLSFISNGNHKAAILVLPKNYPLFSYELTNPFGIPFFDILAVADTIRQILKERGMSGIDEMQMLPTRLTAENGMKGLLSGEFYELVEVDNEAYCGCGSCDFCIDFPEEEPVVYRKVPVSWDTIKSIYATIVKHVNDQAS